MAQERERGGTTAMAQRRVGGVALGRLSKGGRGKGGTQPSGPARPTGPDRSARPNGRWAGEKKRKK
jgi:hypothetical protein